MIKESFSLYNRYLIQILILSLIIVIPLTCLIFFAIQYLYQELEPIQYPNIYALFMVIINFTLLIPMFKKLAENDLEDREDLTTMELSYEFLRHFGMILLLSIPLYILGWWGSILFYIPTIICLLFILLIPFYVYKNRIRDAFKSVGRLIRDENIQLLSDILIIVSVQLIAYGLITLTLQNFDNNLYVYALARAILNAFIFPFLIFYLTLRYRNEQM